MFRNHLKIAWRNLRKQKVFTLINLFGLTTGLAAFLLIALYVFDELTYDQFHRKAADIYRVVETKTSAGGKQTQVVSVAANVSFASRREIPGVTEATRFGMLGRTNVSNPSNDEVFYESFYVADAAFFRVFDFPVSGGLEPDPLAAPHTVVISDEMAKKLFGTTAVVGRSLKTDQDSLPYRITGVVRIPDNSHLRFHCLFSEATLYANPRFAEFMNSDWSSNNFVTYLLLQHQKPEVVASLITGLVKKNRSGSDNPPSSFILQPLTSIHFHSAGMEGNEDSGGNIMHLYVFGIVALFVLLIACINYINLTTARFSGRSKEIAVRKVSGASRQTLVRQFLTEASLLTFVALILALLIVKLVLPRFNAFTQKQLLLGAGTDYRIWIGIVLTAVLCGLVSGLYPSLFQSRLKPQLLLKNKIPAGKSHLSARRMLVVFQFCLSIVMIIATVVVYQQLKYVKGTDLGFQKDQLLVVDINSGAVRRSAPAIVSEFEKLPAIRSVSVTSRVPGEWKVIPKVKLRGPANFSTRGEDVYFMGVDEHFLSTFGASLQGGRNFRDGGTADSASVLLNETAARMMGFREALGQLIEIPSVAFSGNASPLPKPFQARVVGIVRDFNFQSLRDPIAPLVLAYQNNPIHNIDYFTARIETAQVPAILKYMEDVLHRVDPNHLFEYNFLDKQWALFYQEDQKRQTIFLGIALLTILIACLGLFGLATYAAEQRVKEIGIRKVLGASIGNIVSMLSADFARLVVIASLIAFPIAWWCMNSWLADFAYRIRIHWWVFGGAGLAALLIALATVSLQTIRAALSNPVKNLRSE